MVDLLQAIVCRLQEAGDGVGVVVEDAEQQVDFALGARFGSGQFAFQAYFVGNVENADQQRDNLIILPYLVEFEADKSSPLALAGAVEQFDLFQRIELFEQGLLDFPVEQHVDIVFRRLGIFQRTDAL